MYDWNCGSFGNFFHLNSKKKGEHVLWSMNQRDANVNVKMWLVLYAAINSVSLSKSI